MIVILTWPLDHIKQSFWAICSGEYDLPRQCPQCGKEALVGHGRRRRTCYSKDTVFIEVRRGLCKECAKREDCEKTFTFLPCFLRPYYHYSIDAQAAALDTYLSKPKQGFGRAAPHVGRGMVAEESTVRRWFTRLGKPERARKVNCFFDTGENGARNDRGSRRSSTRRTRSEPLGVFLKMWRVVEEAADSTCEFVLGGLRLCRAYAFMFLLLVWHKSGRGAVV